MQTFFSFDDKTVNYFHIRINDTEDASISKYLSDGCNFIGKSSFKVIIYLTVTKFIFQITDTNIKNRKQPCLVYSDLGLSRSAAVVIAYLVYSQRLSLEVCTVLLNIIKVLNILFINL